MTNKIRKTAAVMLAVMFAVAAVFVMVSVPAYAASKPARVSGVKASAKSNHTITVSWKKTANAKKYQVYRAASKKGKYKRISVTKDTSFINSNLEKGTKYYYKVRAVNGSKSGSFSTVCPAKTKNSSLYDVVVDKDAGTVTIKAEVNGKYFKNSTRHLMVDRNGFNKGTAILSSYCTPDDLYNGLVKAGGKSWSKSGGKTLRDGEKNTVRNAENKEFSKIDVTISWGDESYSLKDCLTTKKGGKTSPKVNMVFSGNPKAAARTPSGCMTCMDSCYIGIVANSAYGLCVIDRGNPTLYARSDVLPAGGKVVKVTFRIKRNK